jgi:uncharacterized membrane protein
VTTLEAPRPGTWSAPSGPARPAAQSTIVSAAQPLATNEERALAALCYPLWPLSLLLLLVPLGRSSFVRFHVLQSLGVNGLGLGLYVIYALLANVPVVGWQSAFALPFLVPLWMLGDLYLAVRAAGGHMPRVPFAGDLASKFE